MFILFVGMAGIQPKYIQTDLLLKTAVTSSPNNTILFVNRFIVENCMPDKFKHTTPKTSQKKEKKDKVLKTLFFLLNSVVFAGDKTFLIFILSALYLKIWCSKRNPSLSVRGSPFLAFIRYYLLWGLKFLTPIQKCISSRADEYDIDPAIGLKILILLKTRTFINLNSAGFLFEKNED